MTELLQPEYHRAFVRDGFAHLPATAPKSRSNELGGLRLAVKDVYEIGGLTCGAGSPDWLARQSSDVPTSPAVRLLLEAGADWVGKTVTDELTYSLAGINRHYGTPINPGAPGRLPGGSSSGSAVAVAAGYADLALGTDCGGSVRLPASYCGIWGIRPSHGRVSTDGCFSLAQSFDTVGWFARDGETLGKALECLMHTSVLTSAPAHRWIVSDDVNALLDYPVREAFELWLAEVKLPVMRLPQGSLDLQTWAQAFRILQAAEIWQLHGHWIERDFPDFGADIGARFATASRIQSSEVQRAQPLRVGAQAQLGKLLSTDGMLVLPPVPGIAPRLDATALQVDDARARSQRLLCPAGFAGLPQITFPWMRIDSAPIGLSVIGPRFADEETYAAAMFLSSMASI